MNRNILLVEPGYRTKFPPLGLMKISAYHKKLGDNVKFVKGINPDVAYDCYWDRVYVSSVFTYNWDITIRTLKYYKNLVRDDLSRIFTGGIMASLMPKAIWENTGIAPKIGVMNKPNALDDDNNLIVDDMIPDYDLFNDSSINYSLINDAYFGYLTRGCPNKCDFCGVKKLEPQFIEYKGIKSYVGAIKDLYGEKEHLVLFDNNILASKRLDLIVSDIIDLGFEKGAKIGFINKAGHISYRQRHVDFNQGIDARLLKEPAMKLLSKIALNPLRIAFDHIKFEKMYIDRIRLAAKYEITNLSNYILYNFQDTPDDLWNRLKINIDLNHELGLKIYSFPMKYIPLNARDRSYIAQPAWNWQYLRGVQRVLNVVKGIVMPGAEFFYRAFGRTPEEFVEILYMPEALVMNRTRVPKQEEIDWLKLFRAMSGVEKKELLDILCAYKRKIQLFDAILKTKNSKVKRILEFYLPEGKNDTSQSKQLELFY